MIALLALALLQHRSMLDQFVPHPTGTNGYEEYLQACDESQVGSLGLYEQLILSLRNTGKVPENPDRSEPQLVATDYLSAQKLQLKTFSNILTLIEAGNNKPVANPRSELKSETLLPEFAQFRAMARLEIHAAYVEFAEGNTGQAIKHLVDDLVFASKFSTNLTIGRFTAIACETMVITELDAHLRSLGMSDLKQLEGIAESELNDPLRELNCLDTEEHMMLGQVAMTTQAGFLGKDIGFSGRGNQVWEKASADEKNQAAERATADIKGVFDGYRAVFTGPESAWRGYLERNAQGDAEDHSIEGELLLSIGPVFVCEAAFRAEAIKRIQWSLLHLHCQILEYKWQHGSFPRGLADCVTPAEMQDQISGGVFQYKFAPDGYRLWSNGFKGTGEIELKYTPPFNDPSGPATP